MMIQVHTAAWSGLGMYTNCCGGNTTMPSIFSRTLATVNVDNTWKWSNYVPTPDNSYVICITKSSIC